MQKPHPSQSSTVAYLMLTATMLMWAGNQIVGKWADGHIPPVTLACLRWIGAALIMLPFAWSSMKAEWPVIRQYWARLLVLGMLGSGAYNTLNYIALTETTVTNAAILNSWAPVLIVLSGAAIFGDRLKPFQLLGLSLSLTGVCLIILRGELTTLATLSFNPGDLLMLFATAVWAIYTTMLRTRPAISTMAFAGVTYTVAGLSNIPLALAEHAAGHYMVHTPQAYAAVLYTAIFPSCLAYFFYTRGVEIIGANRTGAFIHLIPLFATLMAMALLGEQPHLYHLAGFALILGGVWMASRR